jgi:hypothetical protein
MKFSGTTVANANREETNTEASLLITPLAAHNERQKITFSTRRGERVYSRECAFHVLLISSASYTERALYLARANDGQTAGPSNYWECLTDDCRGSEILEILREFD